LTQLIRSRSIRSRSDGYGGLRVARAAELDLARRILIQWPGTLASGGAVGSVGQRRRPAVGGGGARRRSRTRAPGHDLKHREHLRVAREAAKLLEVARAATTRRSDRTTRRRGTGTSARSLGRHGARARQQVVQDDSLPLCADPGWLTATRQRRRRGFNGGGGNLGFQVPAHEGLAARARLEEFQGRRPAINSLGRTLGVRATHGGGGGGG
jgi:hypothetical protein